MVADPPLTTEEQLAVVDELASAIGDVYLYPEVVDDEWQALVAAARGRVEVGAETDAFYEEMRNLVNALGDEHSQFQSPAEVAASEAERPGRTTTWGSGFSSSRSSRRTSRRS